MSKLFLLLLFAALATSVVGDYGSCTCEAMDGTGNTERRAKQNAKCEWKANCKSTFICKKASRGCRKKRGGFNCNGSGGQHTCTPSCRDEGPTECISPGGYGDPHFQGFDGSRFDFHGEDNHNYIVFGKQKGDLLVAKVRATPELYGQDMHKTYFSEFGLQIADSHNRMHFYLKRSGEGKKWLVKTTLNNKEINSNLNLKGGSIRFHSDSGDVSVDTKHNKFTIRGVSLSSRFRRHVDFKVEVKGIAQLAHNFFTGILGMTLSRRLGSNVHSDVHALKHANKLQKINNEINFEKAMRQHYDVPTLFPDHSGLDNLYALVATKMSNHVEVQSAVGRELSVVGPKLD